VHGPSPDAAALSVAAPWRWAAGLAIALSLFVASGIAIRSYWFGDGHLFLAQDSAGDVGLFAGAQGTFLGLPLRVERTAYHVTVSDLSASDQRRLDDGITVDGADAAATVVARWQAQSRR